MPASSFHNCLGTVGTVYRVQYRRVTSSHANDLNETTPRCALSKCRDSAGEPRACNLQGWSQERRRGRCCEYSTKRCKKRLSNNVYTCPMIRPLHSIQVIGPELHMKIKYRTVSPSMIFRELDELLFLHSPLPTPREHRKDHRSRGSRLAASCKPFFNIEEIT